MGIFHKKNSEGIKEPTKFTNGLVKTFSSTSKQLIWFYSINGVAWIWCSYVLAFMGRGQIAESLSSNVCTIVIGQIGFYLITKTIENVFKYNDIFKAHGDSKSKEEKNESEVNYDVDIQIPQPIPVPVPEPNYTDEYIDTGDEPVG